MDSKKPWLSKTIWINSIMGVLLAAASLIPSLKVIADWIAANAGIIGVAWAALGVAVRLITKDQISLGD